MSTLPPAGWFEDPDQPGGLRFWDGERWTDHRHADVSASPAAAPAAAASPDVAARLPAAAWWARAAARLLDAVIVGVAITIAAVIDVPALTATVILGAVVVYPWLWMGLDEGRTLGKRALGIRVVDRDGNPVGVGRAALRELLCITVLGLLALPLLLSYLWPLWDPTQRALHDHMAGTRVVRS